MKITLDVDKNDVVHSKIECAGSFTDTLRGIRLCIDELECQIENKNKCPFSRSALANERKGE